MHMYWRARCLSTAWDRRTFTEKTRRYDVTHTNETPEYPGRFRSAKLRLLDVTEVKTVPYVPLSHPFIERLIGTVRREYLDHVHFWSTRDLETKLMSFQDYYNKDRVHRGLDGALPNEQGGVTDR